MTITPSSGTATTPGEVISVLVRLNLAGAESMDAAQLGLSLSNNQTIFAISPNPLTSANGTTSFAFNQAPQIDPAATSPSGFDMVRSGGFFFSGTLGAGSYQMAAFDLVATSTVGTVHLFLDTANTFYAFDTVIQENFSGTIGSFSFVPEPPTSLLLIAAAGLALVGRRRRQ